MIFQPQIKDRKRKKIKTKIIRFNIFKVLPFTSKTNR